jgi:hypothetical protein
VFVKLLEDGIDLANLGIFCPAERNESRAVKGVAVALLLAVENHQEQQQLFKSQVLSKPDIYTIL